MKRVSTEVMGNLCYRVAQLSFAGCTITAFSGVFYLILSVRAGDTMGAGLGLFMIVIGMLEFAGGNMVQFGNFRGFRLIWAAHALLVSLLLGCAVGGFASVSEMNVIGRIPTTIIRRIINMGATPEAALIYAAWMVKAYYAVLAITVVAYQRVMAARYSALKRQLSDRMLSMRAFTGRGIA